MVGWHHRLNGHEFESTLGVGDGQGGLACCDSWGRRESATTEQLNTFLINSYMPALQPMDCRLPGLPVFNYLPQFAQTHVHQVGDAIQPSHLLLSPSPPALNLSQHQSLFQ